MISFTTHKFFFLTRKEVWLYNGEKTKNESYTAYIDTCLKLTKNVFLFHEYETLVIDLKKDESELINNLHPRLLGDIQFAKNLQMTFEVILNPTTNDCEYFRHVYNQFAKKKDITGLS